MPNEADTFSEWLDQTGYKEKMEEENRKEFEQNFNDEGEARTTPTTEFNKVFGSPNESNTSSDNIHPTEEERTEAEKDFKKLFGDAL